MDTQLTKTKANILIHEGLTLNSLTYFHYLMQIYTALDFFCDKLAYVLCI